MLAGARAPTINSGISLPPSGSQRGHSEGAGAERDGGQRKKRLTERRLEERGEGRQTNNKKKKQKDLLTKRERLSKESHSSFFHSCAL